MKTIIWQLHYFNLDPASTFKFFLKSKEKFGGYRVRAQVRDICAANSPMNPASIYFENFLSFLPDSGSNQVFFNRIDH
jgi:hypothetical protein